MTKKQRKEQKKLTKKLRQERQDAEIAEAILLAGEIEDRADKNRG